MLPLLVFDCLWLMMLLVVGLLLDKEVTVYESAPVKMPFGMLGGLECLVI